MFGLVVDLVADITIALLKILTIQENGVRYTKDLLIHLNIFGKALRLSFLLVYSQEKIHTDTLENKDSNLTSKIDFMDLFDPLQILIAIVDCMGRVDIPIDSIGQV